jgi:bacterioferritin-associated ferredoxin
MVICSCNVLTDHEIRDAVATVGARPLNARLIYGCFGFNVQCGRCTRTIQQILDEALAAAPPDPPAADLSRQPPLALAAVRETHCHVHLRHFDCTRRDAPVRETTARPSFAQSEYKRGKTRR